MIDTDKYEGHTPAPWMVCCEDSTLYARWIQADEKSVCSDLNDATEVDAQLIADAPLLLEHVKRLTKTLELIGENMEYDAWMHTLIKDVIGYKKVIE